jgi:uncharacterized protein YndB with AHSA1/START domain
MEPVRKEIVVEAPPERAFRVFTDKFDKWWPREHHIGKSDLKEAVIVDGSECNWGKVLVWEPPKRLVMAWQLNGDWEYDPALITELELRFTPVGPMRTRVELEHRDMERFGEKAAQTRGALDSDQGWIMHLTLLAKAVKEETPAAGTMVG